MPDPVALFATVVLLFPMGYFLLAAPAFLLVSLDIPPVTQLLRGMFSSYFLMVAIAGAVGTVAVALTGRLFVGFIRTRRKSLDPCGAAWHLSRSYSKQSVSFHARDDSRPYEPEALFPGADPHPA